MDVTILKYREYSKNTLYGFCEISINGLKIRDCSHHRKDEQEWLNLPSKSYESDGQTKYYSLVQFLDKTDHWRFQDAARDALKRYFAREQTTGTDDVPFNE